MAMTKVWGIDINDELSYQPRTGCLANNLTGSYTPDAALGIVNGASFGITTDVDGTLHRYLKFSKTLQQYAIIQFAAQDTWPFAAGSLSDTIWPSSGVGAWNSFAINMWIWLEGAMAGGSFPTRAPQSILAMKGGGKMSFSIGAGGAGEQTVWSSPFPTTRFYDGAGEASGWHGGSFAGYSGSGLTNQWGMLTCVFKMTGGTAGAIDTYVNAVKIANASGTWASASATPFDGAANRTIYFNRSPFDNLSATTTYGNIRLSKMGIYTGVAVQADVDGWLAEGFAGSAPPQNPGNRVLPELGFPVSSRMTNVSEMARREWGSEYSAPDRRIYEFSGGRSFDSSDRGETGIYRRPT